MNDKLLIAMLASVRDALSNMAGLESDYNKVSYLLDISNAIDFYIDALESKN